MDILSSKTITSNLFKKPELNWGIISTARISAKVIPTIQASKHNNVLAVASRELNRARDFADSMAVPVAYGSYDDLLHDANVQAVYIPLPNHEHMSWTIKALEAGKHVLVEKPFALSADQAQQMVAAANDHSLVLMENFMYRHHSRIPKTIELIKRGEIGKIRFIESSFSFPLENPDDFRLVPGMGGGVLYDLGCYCINFQRLMLGREPLSVQSRYHEGGSGVDLQMLTTLDFGEQTYGSFEIAFNAARQQHARIVGTEGTISLDLPFNQGDKGVSTIIERGDDIKKINYRSENTYQNLIEHFYQVVIRKEMPMYPLADAVKNMSIIDAVFQSAVDGGKLVIL